MIWVRARDEGLFSNPKRGHRRLTAIKQNARDRFVIMKAMHDAARNAIGNVR
jgi:hypothetical protein